MNHETRGNAELLIIRHGISSCRIARVEGKGGFPCWRKLNAVMCLHLFRVAGELKKVEKSFRRSSRPSTPAL
jgi:hypothetical protein